MKRFKVMLVDDEVIIIEGMRKLFNWANHGCEVVCIANDGVEAVNKAAVYEPDIVIMDINLPILSGLEAIHIIKEKRPDTAFVIVSGYDEFEYCREALRLKIVDYMLKPLDFMEFASVIERIKLELLKENSKIEKRENIQEKKEESKMIFRLIAFLQEHLDQDISLPVLAQEFHLNPAYISQMFKNETGIKYYSYLTELRMNRAKTLLMTTDASITEISESVGYRDYRVFSKTFKNCMGVSPSGYQKSLTER